jgi:hypothetical protein
MMFLNILIVHSYFEIFEFKDEEDLTFEYS